MSEDTEGYEGSGIRNAIVYLRGQPVILDADLARAYGVTTGALNQAVKRNAGRFPAEFVYELTRQEVTILKSQIVISRSQAIDAESVTLGEAKIPSVSRGRHGGSRHCPLAFTEHGAIMAAMVLNSHRAVQMSVFVVRAFVSMRSLLLAQKDFARKLAELEKSLTERLDTHEGALEGLIEQITRLLSPGAGEQPPRKRIGFLVEEGRAAYRVARRCGRRAHT